MDSVDIAVRVLLRDGLIVYPTETVYGLGADALSEDAVMKVYEAK
ncbi:MAG TPA: Sua5/YciO/YrdC/YwlC family protein, partial [Methanoculleus sp.]|nr:Sua5/YciO/YrdC/YwlC family protein [Methanoculleus sp.]